MTNTPTKRLERKVNAAAEALAQIGVLAEKHAFTQEESVQVRHFLELRLEITLTKLKHGPAVFSLEDDDA